MSPFNSSLHTESFHRLFKSIYPQMSKRIPGSARKSTPSGCKATANSTKDHEATARSKATTNTNPTDPDGNTEDDSPKKTPQASDRFTKANNNTSSADQQWQKVKESCRRAERNAEEKKAKRERKVREEAQRAQANTKAKAESDKAHAKAQAEAHPRRPAPHIPPRPSTHSPKWEYDTWSASCSTFFANPNASAYYFPKPKGLEPCDNAKVCVKGEKLGICHHQLKALLMGSGELNVPWLRRGTLRWHPNKFPGREEVRDLAREMFQMLQRLIDGSRPRDE
ncbi:hypothetical protein V8E51_004157 [Hyaloscypha variabilis]